MERTTSVLLLTLKKKRTKPNPQIPDIASSEKWAAM